MNNDNDNNNDNNKIIITSNCKNIGKKQQTLKSQALVVGHL
jgi:hypothetical protein